MGQNIVSLEQVIFLLLCSVCVGMCRGACAEVDSDTEAVAGEGFKLGCISCKRRSEVSALATIDWSFKGKGKDDDFVHIYKYDVEGTIMSDHFEDRLVWRGSKHNKDIQDASIYLTNVTFNDSGTYRCQFNRVLSYVVTASIVSEVMMYVSIIGLQSLDSSSTSHDKQETEEAQLQEVEAVGTEEQTAVTIASVTYRVVQVTDEHIDAATDGTGAVSVVSAAAFAGAPQAVAQAVIQNQFSNGGSPAGDSVGGETRFAYFPATTVSDGTATAVSVQAASDPALTQAGGQFYVMMSPPDVLQGGTARTIAPRTHTYSAKMDGPRAPRDERRRAQHNEVERRRRDKINNWISKGGILSKACDYIRELRQNNQRLQEGCKEVERVQVDNELLRQQIEELKNDNALLRAQLQQHGIELNGDPAPQ
ncbi:hypothetical protein CRUP_019097 [Coryphaenoides rupestris]|nr:hypothetical protein CRUP_019097 [Coryphaenoides rupestris]